MAKLDLSEHLIHQSLEVVVSKEAVDKHGIDDIVKSVTPGKNWTLTSFSSGGSDVIMRFIDGSLEKGDRPLY